MFERASMAEKSKKTQKINKVDKKTEVVDEKNDKVEKDGQKDVKITTTQPEGTPESTDQPKESSPTPVTSDPESSSDWKTPFPENPLLQINKKTKEYQCTEHPHLNMNAGSAQNHFKGEHKIFMDGTPYTEPVKNPPPPTPPATPESSTSPTPTDNPSPETPPTPEQIQKMMEKRQLSR